MPKETMLQVKTVARISFPFAVIIALGSTTVALADSGAQTEEAHRVAGELTVRFLKAFEDLDLDSFMNLFSPDATVFFPIPEPPSRCDGKEAIRQHFKQVFADIRRNSSATAPPFHTLRPEDLAIQVLSPDAALVTFHLRNSERVARRSLVVARVNGRWLIKHVHASNVLSPTVSSPAPGEHGR